MLAVQDAVHVRQDWPGLGVVVSVSWDFSDSAMKIRRCF
jgi:hypothetical protein